MAISLWIANGRDNHRRVLNGMLGTASLCRLGTPPLRQCQEQLTLASDGPPNVVPAVKTNALTVRVSAMVPLVCSVTFVNVQLSGGGQQGDFA